MELPDPTLPNHPLRKAMVEAIAVEYNLQIADDRDEVALAKATRAANYAEKVWKAAVATYRSTPLTGRPPPKPLVDNVYQRLLVACGQGVAK